MNALIKFAQWLDDKEFLRYRLWEFNMRNTVRQFSWYFLFRVLLLHPIKAFRGFITYRHLVRAADGKRLHGSADLAEIHLFLLQGKHNPRRFIIAPGFCMKPYNDILKKSTCPVGHFNHDCHILENPAILSKDQHNWPKPCNKCNIGTLIKLGIKLGADFYIMTSALDIARDLFLPAMKDNGVKLGVFLLCHYSTEAFTFGLTTCGINGHLVTFCKGDCLNHEDFTRADKGLKEKQTFIEESMSIKLKEELYAMAHELGTSDEKSIEYGKMGNVYLLKTC